MNFLRDKRYSPKNWKDWFLIRNFAKGQAPTKWEGLAMIMIGLLGIFLPLGGFKMLVEAMIVLVHIAWFVLAGILVILGLMVILTKS